jgi:hypothetical protein
MGKPAEPDLSDLLGFTREPTAGLGYRSSETALRAAQSLPLITQLTYDARNATVTATSAPRPYKPRSPTPGQSSTPEIWNMLREDWSRVTRSLHEMAGFLRKKIRRDAPSTQSPAHRHAQDRENQGALLDQLGKTEHWLYVTRVADSIRTLAWYFVTNGAEMLDVDLFYEDGSPVQPRVPGKQLGKKIRYRSDSQEEEMSDKSVLKAVNFVNQMESILVQMLDYSNPARPLARRPNLKLLDDVERQIPLFSDFLREIYDSAAEWEEVAQIAAEEQAASEARAAERKRIEAEYHEPILNILDQIRDDWEDVLQRRHNNLTIDRQLEILRLTLNDLYTTGYCAAGGNYFSSKEQSDSTIQTKMDTAPLEAMAEVENPRLRGLIHSGLFAHDALKNYIHHGDNLDDMTSTINDLYSAALLYEPSYPAPTFRQTISAADDLRLGIKSEVFATPDFTPIKRLKKNTSIAQ